MTLNQHKIVNNVKIASLKSEAMGKLIHRIPDSCLLISSLPVSALRTHVESLGKPRAITKRSHSLASVSHRGITLILFGRSAIQPICLFHVYLLYPFIRWLKISST